MEVNASTLSGRNHTDARMPAPTVHQRTVHDVQDMVRDLGYIDTATIVGIDRTSVGRRMDAGGRWYLEDLVRLACHERDVLGTTSMIDRLHERITSSVSFGRSVALDAVLQEMEAAGALLQECASDVRDGRIDVDEARRLRSCCQVMEAATRRLDAALEAMCAG